MSKIAFIENRLVESQGYISGNHMDQRLSEIYRLGKKMVTENKDLLKKFDLISADQAEAKPSSTMQIYNIVGRVGVTAFKSPVTKAHPVVAAIFVGGTVIVEQLKVYLASRAADALAAELRQTAIKSYLDSHSLDFIAIRGNVRGIAQEKRWKQGEEGFDNFEKADSRRELMTAINNNNTPLQLKFYQDMLNARHRDSYLHIQYSQLLARSAEEWRMHHEAASELYSEAKEHYIKAAELMPSNRLLNDERSACYVSASLAASESAFLKRFGKKNEEPLSLLKNANVASQTTHDEVFEFANILAHRHALKIDDALNLAGGYLKSFPTKELQYHYLMVILIGATPNLDAKGRESLEMHAGYFRDNRELSVRVQLSDPRFHALAEVLNARLLKEEDGGFGLARTINNVDLAADDGKFVSDFVVSNKGTHPLTEGIVLRWRKRKEDPIRFKQPTIDISLLEPENAEVLWFERIAPGEKLIFRYVDFKEKEYGLDFNKLVCCEENRSLKNEPESLGFYQGVSTLQQKDHSDIHETSLISLGFRAQQKQKATIILHDSNASDKTQLLNVDFNMFPCNDGHIKGGNSDGDSLWLYWTGKGFYGYLSLKKHKDKDQCVAFVVEEVTPKQAK